MDPTLLMISIVFGSIGMGMFIYGKKQARLIPVVAGILLMVVPYFVPGVVLMTLVCTALTVLPFLVA